jgi:hypothetical protein
LLVNVYFVNLPVAFVFLESGSKEGLIAGSRSVGTGRIITYR